MHVHYFVFMNSLQKLNAAFTLPIHHMIHYIESYLRFGRALTPSNDNSHLLMIKDAIEATKSMLDIETISNDEINSLSSILVQLKDNTVIQYNTQLFKIINFCHEYLEILPQISLAKI